jgi:hypothetical protein
MTLWLCLHCELVFSFNWADMLKNVDKYVDKCSKLWISGSPSFRGKYPSRRGEGREERRGGPLRSPAVPIKDGDSDEFED